MKKFGYIAPLLAALILPLGASAADQSIPQLLGISDTVILVVFLTIITLLMLLVRGLGHTMADINKTIKKSGNSMTGGAKAIATLILSASFLGAQAQGEYMPNIQDEPYFTLTDTMFWLLVFVTLFLTVTVLLMRGALKTLLRVAKEQGYENVPDKINIFKSLYLTDRVPVEKEEVALLDHEYDGIRELDNNLPPWWKYMFYATIIFSVIYLVRFHVTGTGPSSIEEYTAEVEAAVATKAEAMADAGDALTEDNVVYLVDAETLEKGAKIYTGSCATCHGQLGEGLAGPNLTDEYWIHGGGIKEVFTSIKYGIPEKGMIAWESQFSPEALQAVSSYVLSLQGSNPPGAKDPQGEIWVADDEETGTEEAGVVIENEAKPE